jgi:hypothetical protein
MPSVAAIFAPLTLLLLWPLAPRLTRRAATVAALLCIAVAGGIALWVRLDPVAESVPPYPSRK